MNLFLMNKDKILMEFKSDTGTYFNPEPVQGKLPDLFGNYTLSEFLESRIIGKKRIEIKKILRYSGCTNIVDILKITYGLSLTDTLWVKEVNSDVKWNDINFYDNYFDSALINIFSPDISTDGMLPKSWIRRNNGIYLLKGGTKGTPSMGREPISEYLVSQIENALNLNHVPYSLKKHNSGFVSECPLMTDKKFGIIPYGKVFNISNYYDIIDTGRTLNIEKDFKDMFALDILTGNNDRHLSNIQLVFDNDTFEIKELFPVFDNGQGMCSRVPEIKLSLMQKKFQNTYPALCYSFDEHFKEIVSEEFYIRLKSIRNFEFQKSEFISDEDLSGYNKFINWRIEDMLKKYESPT